MKECELIKGGHTFGLLAVIGAKFAKIKKKHNNDDDDDNNKIVLYWLLDKNTYLIIRKED